MLWKIPEHSQESKKLGGRDKESVFSPEELFLSPVSLERMIIGTDRIAGISGRVRFGLINQCGRGEIAATSCNARETMRTPMLDVWGR
jgi:hypothetical protein